MAACDAQPVASLRRLPPVEPRQLLAAGLNYRTHVIDLMVDQRVGSRPDMGVEEIRAEATAIMDERADRGVPFLWVGLPTSVCGPDDDILLRADSERTDWEARACGGHRTTCARRPARTGAVVRGGLDDRERPDGA